MSSAVDSITENISRLYSTQSRRIFATLVRLLGDFDIAEEALQDAFAAAVQQWPSEGVPKNPRAWLVSAGRFKAIDKIRRQKRFTEKLPEVAHQREEILLGQMEQEDHDVADDRLRLIFTCCHPALSGDIQIALTLREVCGLTTEEVANAFLITHTTMAQRLVRGKSKIRKAGIPYAVPAMGELRERLDAVLAVIYLVFNEGYSPSGGESLTRPNLSAEAIRLGRLVLELHPDPEAMGLLALMLLHESRRRARTSASGDIVLLDDQDRDLWDAEAIQEGQALVVRALPLGEPGPYALQAAIAAVHSEAAQASDTDWKQIVALYDLLLQKSPSPVVELNRAVALAMRDGPEVGLSTVDIVLARGTLDDYHLAHAARADLCRRLGKMREAKEAYLRALHLANQEPEKRYLQRRIRELDAANS